MRRHLPRVAPPAVRQVLCEGTVQSRREDARAAVLPEEKTKAVPLNASTVRNGSSQLASASSKRKAMLKIKSVVKRSCSKVSKQVEVSQKNTESRAS